MYSYLWMAVYCSWHTYLNDESNKWPVKIIRKDKYVKMQEWIRKKHCSWSENIFCPDFKEEICCSFGEMRWVFFLLYLFYKYLGHVWKFQILKYSIISIEQLRKRCYTINHNLYCWRKMRKMFDMEENTLS